MQVSEVLTQSRQRKNEKEKEEFAHCYAQRENALHTLSHTHTRAYWIKVLPDSSHQLDIGRRIENLLHTWKKDRKCHKLTLNSCLVRLWCVCKLTQRESSIENSLWWDFKKRESVRGKTVKECKFVINENAVNRERERGFKDEKTKESYRVKNLS